MESVETQDERLDFSYKRMRTTAVQMATIGAKRLPPRRVTSHDVLLSLLLAVTTATLIAVMVISGIVFVGKGVNINSGKISDTTYTHITPAKWSLIVTGAIYITQLLWVLHAWSFSFRRAASRTISWITCLLFCAANVAEIAWTPTLAKRQEHFAFVLVLETGLFLYIALGEACHHLHKMRPQLTKRKCDLWLTRILAVNGLAAYATWTNVKILVSFAAALQYLTHLTATASAMTALSVLAAETLAYCILESTLFANYFRWMYAIYPVQLWFLAGILSAHWQAEGEDVSAFFVLGLFILTAVCLFFKVCLHICVTLMQR